MQICVLFSATEVLHNSLCINIHTNNALLCNRAVITSRQEAAARNRTIQPLAIPCRSLHRTNVHSCTHRRVPAAARPLLPQLQSPPSQGAGTTCLAPQPRVTLQGCHKHLSCSLKKKKKNPAPRGYRERREPPSKFPSTFLQPQQFQKTEKSDTPHSPLEAGFGVLYRKHSHMYVGVLIVFMAKLQSVRP